MKKLLTVLLAVLMVLALAACGSKTETTEPTTDTTDDGIKVAVLLPFVGDQSYFDTLARGVEEANKIDGVTVDLFECDPAGAAEESNWMGWYDDVCEDGKYDLVVSGNNTYEGFLYKACEKYPDQMFMNFDYSATPETGIPANCYCVNYACDDLGYAAGLLSANLTKTGVVGVVVGMENQAMNQFIGGWCQVLAANDVKYVISYPGSFTDTAKGKEVTEELIGKGADVIWQVAGGLGNGVIEACSGHEDVWCIGVDQDQYGQFAETNPTWANTIITSAQKNTNNVIVGVVNMVKEGTFNSKLGTAEAWDFTMNGVGLAENDFYKANVSEEVRTVVANAIEAVKAGDVQVVDTMEWDAATYEAQWPTVRDANRID